MKVKLKVESKWLDLERKSMSKMKRNYEDWERETLRKAKDASDLRDLRKVFYELGDRWEFDQATGAWLEGSEPLDTIGLVLRMPGLRPNKERYVVYAVMAYSKGLTQQFDHLGDKERIIVERDVKSGQIQCWSTTGHGSMDLFPTDLTKFGSIENALDSSYLLAQPGDHALRLELPTASGLLNAFIKRLWDIAGGTKSFHTKSIDVLTADDIENSLDFRFHRYAASVIELDKIWRHLTGSTVEWAKERVLDKIPDHIEERDRISLRKIEGLLHILWFRPPYEQLQPIESLYEELQSEPTPTATQRTLVPLLGELAYSLTDVVEKAKYIKWKSVIDQKSFSKSDVFKGLDISSIEREAFAAALEDILKEHTLAYIGYPERATMKNKIMRVLLGSVILPVRILSSFLETLQRPLRNLLQKEKIESTENTDSDESTESEETRESS
ncbi:MAG: hypothetical protein E4H14_01410 [Candidatus Thorarchaeota archaeon]|nr:MAG: hypothetical protein E4H14_01410 [Candidatus Thorarchaeota archaeon]